jgi:hypothetical protein
MSPELQIHYLRHLVKCYNHGLQNRQKPTKPVPTSFVGLAKTGRFEFENLKI